MASDANQPAPPALVRYLLAAGVSVILLAAFKASNQYYTRLVPPDVKGNAGLAWVPVVVFFVLFTAIVFLQALFFQRRLRRAALRAWLNPDSRLAEWIETHAYWLAVVTLAVSMPIAVHLMLWVYTLSWMEFGLLAAVAAVFALLAYSTDRDPIRREVAPHVREMIADLRPIVFGSLLIFAVFSAVAMRQTGNVFEIETGFDTAVVDHVVEEVDHGWRPFRVIARISYFAEVLIKSLQTIGYYGDLLFIPVFLATYSLVPAVGVSFLLMQAMRRLQRPLETYGTDAHEFQWGDGI